RSAVGGRRRGCTGGPLAWPTLNASSPPPSPPAPPPPPFSGPPPPAGRQVVSRREETFAMRAHFPLLVIGCALLTIFLPRAPAAEAANPPPNFIVILCDNLGYGDVGCYGSKLHRTPHIDPPAAHG